MNNLNIENNDSADRWEAHVDQHLAVAEYRRKANTIFFIHTEVPRELAGKGVGSRLVKTALDDARAQHLVVVPFCPFVASYIQRHPDYKDMVHPDYRDLVEVEPGEDRMGEACRCSIQIALREYPQVAYYQVNGRFRREYHARQESG